MQYIKDNTPLHLTVHTVALEKWQTTLAAWFELNKKDEFPRNIKYVNILQYYEFKNKKWNRRIRKRTNYAIERIGVVSPKDSERHHLKLILNQVKGAQSFKIEKLMMV